MSVIETRTKAISAILDDEGKKLTEVLKSISITLDMLLASVTTAHVNTSSNYKKELHQLLIQHKEKISKIEMLAEHLIKRYTISR